ncbi:MAG: methyltransferase domain-containing protein [Bacteroidota bacterium]
MTPVISRLPEWAKRPLRHIRDVLAPALYYGEGRFCPICGKSSRRFRTAGVVPRPDAQCVYCGALERHRLLWLFLQKNTDLFDGNPKKMLHVAPEPCFESRFRELLDRDYLTADLSHPHVMVKMDIANIPCTDQSFDVILCSHVLEHVPDDKKGMREFYRVLKKDGWAILLVPIVSKKTLEDPSLIDPRERLRAFGQKDHARRYGLDYVERLREAGFMVAITMVSDLTDKEGAERMGLTPDSGVIYYCTK